VLTRFSLQISRGVSGGNTSDNDNWCKKYDL